MMFGTAASLYAAPGITSAASRAAQSGPTQFVTSDAAGNLATANFSPQDITSLGASVATLQQDLQRGLAQARGTAIAIALGGALRPRTSGLRSRPIGVTSGARTR